MKNAIGCKTLWKIQNRKVFKISKKSIYIVIDLVKTTIVIFYSYLFVKIFLLKKMQPTLNLWNFFTPYFQILKINQKLK